LINDREITFYRKPLTMRENNRFLSPQTPRISLFRAGFWLITEKKPVSKAAYDAEWRWESGVRFGS
jgi:hypothetical protein